MENIFLTLRIYSHIFHQEELSGFKPHRLSLRERVEIINIEKVTVTTAQTYAIRTNPRPFCM
jgi:hypothetical protein